ncbi:hypothetical protein EG329_007429 [Mollisiaceae sp. DMI_Dod_QoI]|nr:hypothetical protein EG329_007429 [Helotiales sp. DMI_Dod_QoI]
MCRRAGSLCCTAQPQCNENFSDDDSHVSSPAYTRILLDLSLTAQTVSDHASRAMDGLSAAASVIAVIQISEDIVSLCSQYLKAVKNAKSDIVRLQGDLSNLKTVLEGAQKLLEGPDAARLETSLPLLDGLRGCYWQLEDLGTKLKDHLKTKHKGKGTRFFGLSALKWPFESKKVDNIIQTLSKFQDTLSAALKIDQTTLLLDSFERVNEEERFKILEWISSIQYGKHHETVKEARTSNTCEWLLQDEGFRKWEDATSSVILWLQGSPGAGKTFLTSRVIDHIQGRLESSPNQEGNPEGFAFFYCNRNEEERRKPLSVLRSYTRQLSITAGHLGEMHKKLRDLWRETILTGSDFGFNACREQLLESVNLYPRTTLILDALDECDPDSRDRLVEIIELLLSSSKSLLRVFISSRPDADIRDRFLSRPNIKIQATNNQDDIKKFVNEEIVKHRRWNKISAQLRDDVVKTILARSEGMFQWVFLQTRQLLELQTEAAVRDRLGKLPVGLNAAYGEIYSKIAARNEHEKVLADRAFMWVMCACKPLKSDELLSAIRLDPKGDITHLSEEVDEGLLLDLCNNLLVLDSQRNVWKFSHLSVTEYFEKNHWDLEQAHCYAAKICLLLLIETYKRARTGSVHSLGDSHNYDSRARDIFDPKHPLQNYSRHHWIKHIQTQEEQEPDPRLVDLLKFFLGSPGESSSQYQQWYLQVMTDLEIPLTSAFRRVLMDEISPENSTVFAMCRFSFYTLLSDWWRDAEIPPSQTNSRGDNLLTLAAAAGCRPICEALIKRGAQVDLQNGEYGSALAVAAWRGEIETIMYLIEQGADVNLLLQTGGYGSTLAVAAWWGEIETVKYLIEQGADVNLLLPTGDYGSALAAAAWTGKIETVKYLVKQGADVNLLLKTGDYGSALAAATRGAKTEIVKYLIEQGADVNLLLRTGSFGSALAVAAWLGKNEIVKYLIEQGADVNLLLQTGGYGSALAVAAWWGETETVKYLIEQGADVNLLLQTGGYGSALVAAAWRGKTETVKYLIEQGADVNLLLPTGAGSNGVEILIDLGAKVDLRSENGSYSTAFHAS